MHLGHMDTNDTNAVPPILEIEDNPIPSTSPFLDTFPATSNKQPSVPYHRGKSRLSYEIEQNRNIPTRTLGAEQPSVSIDEHDYFWTTYDRVASAYDRELLDAWNKSLDVLLIFAGLFSAINTAFIMEAYKGLRPDPAEMTNTLLRLLISHRHDNITLSTEELNAEYPAISTIPINSLFFSSLTFSLLATLGAVSAKQWLTEYTNVGAMNAVNIQGRRRQQKYRGLKAWRLRLIIEILPMLLQLSLLLFLIGVVHFLWTLDHEVATIQLILSGGGVVAYLITLIIGILNPESPFQTPFSKYFPPYFARFRRTLQSIPQISYGFVERMGVFRNRQLSHSLTRVLDRVIHASISKRLESLLMVVYRTCGKWVSRSRFGSGINGDEGYIVEVMHWDETAVTAAESVIWLLEQAEHPDATIAALDAVPRLPPDLLLSLISKREGLLERLVRFHIALLPPTSAGHGDVKWVRAWHDKAIVSGMALWHILKAQLPSNRDPVVDSLLRSIRTPLATAIVDDDPLSVTKFILSCNIGLLIDQSFTSLSRLRSILQSSHISEHSVFYQVSRMDTRQSSNGNTFITSASSFHLALDALVYLAYTNSSGSNSFRHATISVEQYLSYKLCDELSRSTISHIALAIAAIHWSHRRDHPWSYPSFADQLRFQHLIIKNSYVVDKSSILLENVALALSVIDVRHPIQSSDYEPFSTLFTTTSDLFIEGFQEPGKTIPYPHFPQSLLRLARRNPSDYKMLFRIAQLLALCPDGDWASPLHGEYGQDMIHLLGTIFSPHSVKFLGSTPGPAFGLLDKMARGSNDGMFLRTIESQDGLLQYRHEAIRLTAPLFIRGCGSEFGKKVLLLRSPGSCSSALLETQISLVMAILTKGSWLWDPIHNAVAVFFNQMLEDDGDLHWPPYFISLGIIQSDTRFTKVESAARLRFIEPSKLVELSSSYQWFGSGGVAREWYGEAVLLMWKKARKELSQGCPSSSWEESTFFTTSAVQIMLQYHKHVQYHKHDGVERGLLKDYLERALLASEAEGPKLPWSEHQREERCRRLKVALEELNEFLVGQPASP